jgi:hypothetical protein
LLRVLLLLNSTSKFRQLYTNNSNFSWLDGWLMEDYYTL